MTDVPATSYARTVEGAFLAYQILGIGPMDLMLPQIGGVPIELMWEEPAVSACLHRLATFSRVITLDVRGFGSSGRVDAKAVPALQTWMDDLLAVMDAVGSDRATVFSSGEPALAAMLFAATYPRRVSSLILVNAYARFLRNEECPWGLPTHLIGSYSGAIEETWGTGALIERQAPSMIQSDDAKRRWARAERLSATPDSATAVSRAFMESDVTHVLAAIQAPTLVISRSGDRHVRPQHSRYLASHIAGARLVELSGEDHFFFSGQAEEVLDEVQEFMTGLRPLPVFDRVLATVMFTDIVRSTEHLAQLGDRRWRESLNRYDELVRHQLERFRGNQVNTTGDGTLATFDGPARAVECARTISDAVRGLGFEIRAGLHTGEVESRGKEISGVAVHIAARVSDLADAGQVLVSRTVTDLVAGSGIDFEDRGDHELKGVPGSWRLYSVRA